MTRYVMVADLRRCVGCQTCTAACKHANATPPGVQWRQVLDMETGTYPQVQRTFVPVGCMHCADPPCETVCPSTATKIRPDGIVSIDYDLCIGCGYCAVACPYQARHIVHKRDLAYGNEAMAHEDQRHDEGRMSVAMKTPACVNACLADALHFGDKDDPDSNVNQLLAENQTFRMHEDLGTDPGFYYIWDKK
jgi:phenylacetyl-CoA:acceptor oxidoreductase subunit 1